MMSEKKQYWFKRRRFGYGWVPTTWQGWLVIAVYATVVISSAMAFLDGPQETADREKGVFFLILLMSTVALMQISRLRGPKAHWRWGKRSTDNPEEDF